MDFNIFDENESKNIERIEQERQKKVEAERAARRYEDSSEHQNIKNKLGLNQRATRGQIKTALKRYIHKERHWRILKITREDFEEYGLL